VEELTRAGFACTSGGILNAAARAFRFARIRGTRRLPQRRWKQSQMARTAFYRFIVNPLGDPFPASLGGDSDLHHLFTYAPQLGFSCMVEQGTCVLAVIPGFPEWRFSLPFPLYDSADRVYPPMSFLSHSESLMGTPGSLSGESIDLLWADCYHEIPQPLGLDFT
jgi:hypothetical protein